MQGDDACGLAYDAVRSGLEASAGELVAVVEPEIGYDKAWWRSMAALDGADTKRVARRSPSSSSIRTIRASPSPVLVPALARFELLET